MDYYLVSGRVQGVGYRAWCKSCTEKLELTGWVRNLSDKRVELLVYNGEQGGLEALEALLPKGPLFASVATVQHRKLIKGDVSEDLLTSSADFVILATSATPLIPSLEL